MPISIDSGRLHVEMFSPEDGLVTTRFDRACHIYKVVLDGKHSFCVPEQQIKSRVTSNGNGLCAQFMWPELGLETTAGERFAQLGVGLLTQVKDNQPYDKFGKYEAELSDMRMETMPDRVLFVHDIPECRGVSVRIYREAILWENTLTVFTNMENTGERTLDLSEYNHNFISIDNLPVGPGYHLHIPFDRNLSNLTMVCSTIDNQQPVSELILMENNQTATWSRPMDGLTYFKRTEQRDILPMARYHWKLTHDTSPAWVSEMLSFAPHALALWGVEHCVCPEVYVKINVEPGVKQAWSRTWIFGCRPEDV